jgi:hypothetical protein
MYIMVMIVGYQSAVFDKVTIVGYGLRVVQSVTLMDEQRVLQVVSTEVENHMGNLEVS